MKIQLTLNDDNDVEDKNVFLHSDIPELVNECGESLIDLTNPFLQEHLVWDDPITKILDSFIAHKELDVSWTEKNITYENFMEKFVPFHLAIQALTGKRVVSFALV